MQGHNKSFSVLTSIKSSICACANKNCAHFYSVLVFPSCNTGNTAEHTATAEAEKPADGVEHDERDEGKQVRNRIAIAGGALIITTIYNIAPP